MGLFQLTHFQNTPNISTLSLQKLGYQSQTAQVLAPVWKRLELPLVLVQHHHCHHHRHWRCHYTRCHCCRTFSKYWLGITVKWVNRFWSGCEWHLHLRRSKVKVSKNGVCGCGQCLHEQYYEVCNFTLFLWSNWQKEGGRGAMDLDTMPHKKIARKIFQIVRLYMTCKHDKHIL